MRLHGYPGADSFGFSAGYASVSGIDFTIFWDTTHPDNESGDAGEWSEKCKEGRYRFGNYRSDDAEDIEDTGKGDEDHDPLFGIVRF